MTDESSSPSSPQQRVAQQSDAIAALRVTLYPLKAAQVRQELLWSLVAAVDRWLGGRPGDGLVFTTGRSQPCR